MARSAVGTSPYFRWSFELVFSIYLAALIVSVNRMVATYSLSLRLRSLYLSYRSPHSSAGIDDQAGIRLTSFLLVWLLVVAFFTTFHLLADLKSARGALCLLTGIIAIAGFPVAHMYSGHPAMFFFKAELILSIGCITLYALGRWPVSNPLTMFLLVVHFGLWTWAVWDSFSLGLDMLAPAWDTWYVSKHTALTYGSLAFCCILLWPRYICQLCSGPVKENVPA